MSLVVGVPFLIFWISMAYKMRAPGFFVFFGVAMLIFLVISAGIGIYNATSKDRISQYDITTPEEERDPFDRLAQSDAKPPLKEQAKFCPSCGTRIEKDFRFCPKCGAKQPVV